MSVQSVEHDWVTTNVYACVHAVTSEQDDERHAGERVDEIAAGLRAGAREFITGRLRYASRRRDDER